jgi:hypothetical protein
MLFLYVTFISSYQCSLILNDYWLLDIYVICWNSARGDKRKLWLICLFLLTSMQHDCQTAEEFRKNSHHNFMYYVSCVKSCTSPGDIVNMPTYG